MVVSGNALTPNAGAVGALQAAVGTSAQGLELVREVLFGAEKRQTSEEFNQLKGQLAQSNDQIAKRLAASEQSFNDKLATLTTQTQARIAALEATVTGNRESANAALNQLRAAMQMQHDAFAKTLADEKSVANQQQAAFVAHMRTALDALAGIKKA
jgi:DNA anti-recombination protein RmuC